MAVLVTGGAGYIGSHMVLALLDAGRDEVVVVDDLSTGFAWALPPEVTLVQGDMGDQALVAETIRRHKVDAIAHFAAVHRCRASGSQSSTPAGLSGGFFLFASPAVDFWCINNQVSKMQKARLEAVKLITHSYLYFRVLIVFSNW